MDPRRHTGSSLMVPLALAMTAGMAHAQNPWGVTASDFRWDGPAAETNRVAIVVTLLLALLVLVAYLIHHVALQRVHDRGRRSLVAELERLYGYVHAPDLLQVGQRVEIEVEREGRQRLYRSKVEQVAPSTAELACPLEEGVIVPLRVGDRIGVVVRRTPYSYRFETRVVQRSKGRLPTLTVEKRRRVVRFQRREFLRADMDIPARLDIRPVGDARGSATYSIEARILNLSGAGLLVEAPRPGGKFRFFTAHFTLPPLAPQPTRARLSRPRPRARPRPALTIKAECQVVSSNVTGSGMAAAEFGVQFIEIPRLHREAIVQYALELERRNKRRQADRHERQRPLVEDEEEL